MQLKHPFRQLMPAVLLATGLTLSSQPTFACGMDPFIGTICSVGFNFCPQGYLKADGSLLSIQAYTPLFALIGTTYGGDGQTTFALPDLRGRAMVGAGQGPGLQYVIQGQPFGTATVNLSANQMPGHTHSATFTPTMGSSDVSIPGTTGDLALTANLPVSSAVGTATNLTGTGYLAGVTPRIGTTTVKGPYTTTAPVSGGTLPANGSVSGTPSYPQRTVTVTTVTGGSVTIQAAGGSAPVSTQSPSLGTTVCIAVEGVFPSRP